MKHWKKLLVGCLMAAFLGFALVGCASQYIPTAKDQTVSSSALKENGVLRVGVNSEAAPLAGKTSSSGEIVGIDVDVAAAIADELGVKVKIVDVGTDTEKALSDGTVDIVLGVDDSSDSEVSYWKSSSYLKTGVALFGTQSTTSIPAVDSNPKIAAQVSSKSSWRVAILFGDTSLVAQTDLKSSFNALTAGTVQYVAADAIIGSYISRVNNYQAKIMALLQDASGYCVAVSKTNTELQTAITNAVNTITNGGVVDVIEAKWLGTSIDTSTLTVIKSAAADTTATTATTTDQSSDASSDAAASDAAAGDATESDAS